MSDTTNALTDLMHWIGERQMQIPTPLLLRVRALQAALAHREAQGVEAVDLLRRIRQWSKDADSSPIEWSDVQEALMTEIDELLATQSPDAAQERASVPMARRAKEIIRSTLAFLHSAAIAGDKWEPDKLRTMMDKTYDALNDLAAPPAPSSPDAAQGVTAVALALDAAAEVVDCWNASEQWKRDHGLQSLLPAEHWERLTLAENNLRDWLEAVIAARQLAAQPPAAQRVPFGIKCDACGKTMAEHDALARCPRFATQSPDAAQGVEKALADALADAVDEFTNGNHTADYNAMLDALAAYREAKP